jgi:hypothetical protein
VSLRREPLVESVLDIQCTLGELEQEVEQHQQEVQDWGVSLDGLRATTRLVRLRAPES